MRMTVATEESVGVTVEQYVKTILKIIHMHSIKSMTPKALSREIKFRAWDTRFNDMHYYADVRTWHLNTPDLEECTLMQYTGLHDKNGKEIYENDYLQWGDGVEIMCVFWGSGKYILQSISSGDIIDCNENTASVREIIGNKYESPREHKAMASDL